MQCRLSYRLFIALLLLAAPSTFASVSSDPSWIRQPGTNTSDRGNAVYADGAGNVFMAGQTYGSLGGPSAGLADVFVSKYGSSGNLLWSRQFGSSTDETSTGIAGDSGGNVYITGYTSGNLGGSNAGNNDVFVSKFDGSGNRLWTRQIGTSGNDASYAVSLDATANIYISGSTTGSLAAPNAGNSDAFVSKFDSSGNLQWSRQFGSSGYDDVFGASTDGAGNLYISGSTTGSLNGPNAGNGDAFMSKFDGSGNVLWTRQIGTSADEQSAGVSADNAGNVYITGFTAGSLGGPNAGSDDIFVSEFDGVGDLLGAAQIGSSGHDRAASISTDSAGNFYITGWTDGNLAAPNAGAWDAFLARFSAPAVPEPTSLAVLGFSSLLILRRRRG